MSARGSGGGSDDVQARVDTLRKEVEDLRAEVRQTEAILKAVRAGEHEDQSSMEEDEHVGVVARPTAPQHAEQSLSIHTVHGDIEGADSTATFLELIDRTRSEIGGLSPFEVELLRESWEEAVEDQQEEYARWQNVDDGNFSSLFDITVALGIPRDAFDEEGFDELKRNIRDFDDDLERMGVHMPLRFGSVDPLLFAATYATRTMSLAGPEADSLSSERFRELLYAFCRSLVIYNERSLRELRGDQDEASDEDIIDGYIGQFIAGRIRDAIVFVSTVWMLSLGIDWLLSRTADSVDGSPLGKLVEAISGTMPFHL